MYFEAQLIGLRTRDIEVHPESSCPKRMPLRFEPATRVHDKLAAVLQGQN